MAWDTNGGKKAEEAAELAMAATEEMNNLLPTVEAVVIANAASTTANLAIIKARDAEDFATDAKEKSTNALTISETVKNEFDRVVADAGGNNPEVVLARGNYVNLPTRLEAEKTELAQQLAQTTGELGKKQSYEGSLVELLKKNSVLKNEIMVKVVSETQIDIGIFHQANKATIYTFKPDGDGWWRLFSAIVRPVTQIEVLENYKKGLNFISSTGTWSTSEPTFYTTEVGATFNGEFTGTGFNFNHRADNRGGVWEFVIDGYITKQISTYSDTLKDNVQSLVVKGLANIKHSFIATYKGADPNNPPSGGTARGWANYYTGTGVTLKTITPYINSYSQGNGVSTLQDTSRKEFAFSVRPAGTTMPARWVPEHGNLGAMKDIVTKIFFDNIEVENLKNEVTSNYRIYRDVKFIVNYNAYYTENDTIAWQGRIDQTINGEGYHNRHKFKFLTDLQIIMGYPVMMAVDKNATGNDAIVTSEGKRYTLPENTNDGSSVVLEGSPVSAAHFAETATSPLTNLVIAYEVFDYKRTMRIGEPGTPTLPTRVELRNDGHRKSYFSAFEYHTVNAGKTYDFGWTYFIGEIYNASEILPS